MGGVRRDEATDRVLPNGVVTPAGLRINELTLREHRDRLARGEIDHRLARRAGYGEAEILDVLGAEVPGEGRVP